MNPQLELVLPIPIMEEIISLSALRDKVTFRATCKRFLHFMTKRFFPTFTTILCGSTEGYEDGEFTHVKFANPCFGALNSSLNVLYVSDMYNQIIRQIDLSTDQVTTLCGVPMTVGWIEEDGREAKFRYPSGLALDEKNQILYVSDTNNHVIRGINLINGRVNSIVGDPYSSGKKDGIGRNATLYYPYGLALDSISSTLYVADSENHAIRRILLKENRIETLCGNEWSGYRNGSFEDALFNVPFDLVFNPKTQELYVSDSDNHVIRILSLKDKTVSTLCGTPGENKYKNRSLTQGEFWFPRGLGLDIYSQYLYITDDHHIIKKISLLRKGKLTTLCGIEGEAGQMNGFLPTFNGLRGLVVDLHSHFLYVMDSRNHKVRKIMNKKRALSESEIFSPPQKFVCNK